MPCHCPIFPIATVGVRPADGNRGNQYIFLQTQTDVGRGPLPGAGLGWLVRGYPVQLCVVPGWRSLKTRWAPSQMKSQLDARDVFLTLTRSVIKSYWSLTLPLSLQASLVEVKVHISFQHRILGSWLLFSRPHSEDRQTAYWPLENTQETSKPWFLTNGLLQSLSVTTTCEIYSLCLHRLNTGNGKWTPLSAKHVSFLVKTNWRQT